MQVLTQQELHNLAMNIVGKKLEKMGYEFQRLNSQLFLVKIITRSAMSL